MRQQPWIPAPCRASSKRFSKQNLCVRHRRPSFVGKRDFRDGDKLYVGSAIKSFDRLAWSDGDEALESDLETGNGELRLLNNLRHIKLLYLEAKDKVEALKREVSTCKDELFRARMELESEKDARRSAESRLETMSSAVRELEKVVDAQKDYIRDVRFSQRLRSSSTSKRPEIQGHILSSNGNDGPTVVVVAEKASGRQRTVATMTAVNTSNASVQTVRVVQNQSAQTKTLIDRYSQTETTSGNVDRSHLEEQLEAERRLTRHLRLRLDEYESGSGGGGGGNRANVREILDTVEKLEAEVGELRKRVRQQKLVNVALKQFFRAVESSYVSLFS